MSMTDKMRMQTLPEQILWAEALIAAYPDKQSKPCTVKKCRFVDERGSAVESRKDSVRQKSVHTPTNGLSRKGSYAGEIPQSATKAKNDENWRLHWSWCGKIYLWNPSTETSTLYKKTQNMYGYWWLTHWTQVVNNNQVCLITIIWEII